MKTAIQLQSVLAFFKNNWFKLSLVALALYVWFKKDLTFQVSMGSPGKPEQRAAPAREKFTDTHPILTDKAAVVDKLEIPFIGDNTGKRDIRSEFASINEEAKHAYLKRFAKVAMTEQRKFGIPASLILAAALYQSCAGKRDLAIESNNQFGLSCSGDWQGACAAFQGKQYREYESAWASFRDFSLFLKDNFSHLKGADYKSWAKEPGISSIGETEDFSENLLHIIEAYRLFELDK
jgi:hypothetical protein